MKKILVFLVLVSIVEALHAQQPYIYTIKADSVKITNTCDTAELIIENHTQNVPGFLFNKGRGRTEFRRAGILNDSSLLLGGDTLLLRGNTTASNGLSIGGRDVQLGGILIKDTTTINANGKKLFVKSGNGGRQFSIQSDNYGFATESPVNYFSQLNFYVKDSARREAVIGHYNGSNYDTRNLFVSVGDEYRYSDYPITGIGMRYEIRTGDGGGNKTYFFRNGNVGIGTFNYRLAAKLAVGGTGLFTDTLTATTMGITDSSNRVASTAFVKNALGVSSLNKNFANADLTFTGNRNHNGAFRSLNLNDFGEINFKTSPVDRRYWSELKMDSTYAFQLSAIGNNIPNYPNSSLIVTWQGLGFQLDEEATIPRSATFNVTASGFHLMNNENEWASNSITTENNHESGTNNLNITNQSADLNITNIHWEGQKYAAINLCQGDSIVIEQGANAPGNGASTKYVQNKDKFFFRNAHTGVLDFRLFGLPASSSTTDNTLVVDNNGQVKIRTQSPSRKSATVTGSAYTVPADVEVVFVNYTAGQATITLPTGTLDREITIKNLHTTNTVIISGLDSSESNTIATRGAITVKFTGSAWVGISKY
jgi:hypothetical protein